VRYRQIAILGHKYKKAVRLKSVSEEQETPWREYRIQNASNGKASDR